MSAAMANPEEFFVVEYQTPKAIPRTWSTKVQREETVTTVSTTKFDSVASLMKALAEAVEFRNVLEWASSREDLPEYEDPEDVVSERHEFVIAISPGLRESIERRSE